MSPLLSQPYAAFSAGILFNYNGKNTSMHGWSCSSKEQQKQKQATPPGGNALPEDFVHRGDFRWATVQWVVSAAV